MGREPDDSVHSRDKKLGGKILEMHHVSGAGKMTREESRMMYT